MFRAALIAFAALIWPNVCMATAPTTQPVGTISGKVSAISDIPNIEMVVYLEPGKGTTPLPPPAAPVKVSQRGAKFSPAIAIITVGQRVDFVNDEERLIEHNVFSNAPPKQFDLGRHESEAVFPLRVLLLIVTTPPG